MDDELGEDPFASTGEKWKSEIVQTFDSMYADCKTINERTIFLIKCFLEYRKNHSFGEYDFFVDLDEKVIEEREELDDFLTVKFAKLSEDLTTDTNANLSNDINEIIKAADKVNAIKQRFEAVDIDKSWKYFFNNETEYVAFVKLLAAFFSGAGYTLPETPFFIRQGCKTKIAKVLRDVYSDFGVNKLRRDVNYYEIIRTLSVFAKIDDSGIYLLLTK